jgi:Outer membrane protein beta-barrel domain
MKKRYLIGLLYCMSMIVQAQNDCTTKLKQALQAYELGRISEIPILLNECLKFGFDKTERIEAYKLLTLTHLYSNERESAQKSMKNFLKLYPDYQINKIVDPPEFISLYESFRTSPVFQIAIQAGANRSFITETKRYSLDLIRDKKSLYTGDIAFQVGVGLEFAITKKLHISPSVLFVRSKHSYKHEILEYSTLDLVETQNRVEIPLLARYYFFNTKKKPYLLAGGSANLMVGATGIAVRQDVVDADNQRQVSGPSIDMTAQRSLLTYSAIGGAGIKFDNIIGRSDLMLEFRYQYGLANVTKTSARASNQELVYDYGYIDSDYNLHYASFTINYMMPYYKPKLLKKANKL